MSERAVYKTGKDEDGDITKLCNSNENWSPRHKGDAISDIESGVHSYYVPLENGKSAVIHVVDGPTGKFLRTNWDHTEKNNLDDLPDC